MSPWLMARIYTEVENMRGGGKGREEWSGVGWDGVGDNKHVETGKNSGRK